MASLNIKDEEVHRLAQELAALTGESMTKAIKLALRERLGRLRCETEDDFIARIEAIARDAAPRFKEPYRSAEHGDLLYDEKGLPK